MSSTESLRKDHYLIEKMLKSLNITIELFQEGKKIPNEILYQTIDFLKNFTNICHHGKEEETLFPSLEKNGMARESGPIARMLFEHELAIKLAEKIESSMIEYIQKDDPNKLMENIQNYINHVSSHLMKENLRLFVMADTLLSAQSHNINNALEKIENDKLEKIGKQRKHYEGLANNMESKLKNL